MRYLKLTLLVVLTLAGVWLALQALLSLGWRPVQDTPILLYQGYLMDRLGYVPYRDFFDLNTPGVHWFYWMIGNLSAYSLIGYRLIDLGILALILLMTMVWMRGFSKIVAGCSVILFGLYFFSSGPSFSLQRDYLVLLPVSAALVIFSLPRIITWLRLVCTGLLFGISTTIRPAAALVVLPVVIAVWQDWKHNQTWGKSISHESVYSQPVTYSPNSMSRVNYRELLLDLTLLWGGFALPLIFTVIFLFTSGAWSNFWEIVLNYWPLYNSLSGELRTIAASEKLNYLLDTWSHLGGFWIWLAPALLGWSMVILNEKASQANRRQASMILMLAAVYSIYPLIAGKFWTFHWIPAAYFWTQAASLCLVERPAWLPEKAAWFPAFLLLLVAIMGRDDASGNRRSLFTIVQQPEEQGMVANISNFLDANLQPGDLVQPLDLTGGAVNAMLQQRAEVATPFIQDLMFYHHISSPYIQGLRTRFIQNLQSTSPRFVIEVYAPDKPWSWGENTTQDFPELQVYLAGNYQVALQDKGFRIYERIFPR